MEMVMEHIWRQVKEVWRHERGHGASSWQLRQIKVEKKKKGREERVGT